MAAKIIYLTDEEFNLLVRHLDFGSPGDDRLYIDRKLMFMRDKYKEGENVINFMGYTEEQLIKMIEFWEKHKMSEQAKLTRAEAIALVQNNVFGITNTGQAERWVNFFIHNGMLEVKEEEEEKPIFEIRNDFQHIKIYANGKTQGIMGTVLNRIPELIIKLKQNNS